MKDETLLPDVASLEKVLEWIAGLPVPTKSATANYCRLKNFIIDYNAALQSGNSGQSVTVPDELIYHDKDPEVTKAYKIGFNACLAVVKSATVTVPAGYVLVPAEPTITILDEIDAIFDFGAEDSKDAWHRLLAAAPKTPDGWIPVSERMPDKLIPVMVMYEDGDMWSAIWSGQFWDDGCAIPDPHSITHWRDMPDAPKGV